MSLPKGYKHSEETLKKLRGRFVSEETRRKIGLGNKGRHLSEESINKMRDSIKKGFANGRIKINKGKHLSEETKKKICKKCHLLRHTKYEA
jgi:hypothetical protein